MHTTKATIRILVKEYRRPIIFLGVGVLNTLLDFLFYTFLNHTFFPSPHQIVIVGIISGTFALTCAYFTHSYVTWRDRNVDKATAVRFFIATGFGLWIIRPILLALFINLSSIHIFFSKIAYAAGLHLEYNTVASTISFGMMIIIVMIYNYLVYSKLVFTNQKTITNTD